MISYNYTTIKDSVEDILFKEKGSKFIGFAYSVHSESEIKERLTYLKDLHPKATHHCYAYRLGLQGENHRANDDGEPSGSAGLPIYNQLLSQELTNILVVIIRYYGGTKLGVGGLVKAYKESAKTTLENAQIITKELESQFLISFQYSQQSVILSILNKFEAPINEFKAHESCEIKTLVKKTHKENLLQQLSELNNVTAIEIQ